MSQMKNCERYSEEDLFLWLAGGLSDDEAAGLSAHASECPFCRDRLAGEEHLVARLAEASSPAEPPPAVKGRLMARVLASQPRPEAERAWLARFRRARRAVGWRQAAVTVGLAIAILAGYASTFFVVPPWAELRQEVEARERGFQSQVALRDNQIRALIEEVDLANSRAAIQPPRARNASWPVVTQDGRSVGSIICLKEGLNCFLEASGLERVGPTRVYTLWIQDGNGRLRQLGNFDADTSGEASFYTYADRDLKNARNLLVTVEPWEIGTNQPQGPVIFVSQP